MHSNKEKPWHEDEEARSQIGKEGESEFDHIFLCHCGGRFIKNDAIFWYAPDRRCEECGQLVDPKAPPNSLDYQHITISKIPFEKYPADLIIAVRAQPGIWMGIRKRDAKASGPFAATHKQKATWFYKIDSEDGFVFLWDILKMKI